MDNNKKHFKNIEFKGNIKLNETEFYKELNNAISSHNLESVYELSKIFTRYFFKKLDN